MDVSVIIITRNTCALTGEAVRSVLAADSSVTTEIFVVDNGSNDDTATVLPREFPQIQLLRFEKNLGFARAVNLAVTKSSGEFLVLLNSDARLTADALTLALKWLRANPNCAVAGAQLLNADGSRQNSIANFPTLATELLNKSLLPRQGTHSSRAGGRGNCRRRVHAHPPRGLGRAWRAGRTLLFLFRGNGFLPPSPPEKSPRNAPAAGARLAWSGPDGQAGFSRRPH